MKTDDPSIDSLDWDTLTQTSKQSFHDHLMLSSSHELHVASSSSMENSSSSIGEETTDDILLSYTLSCESLSEQQTLTPSLPSSSSLACERIFEEQNPSSSFEKISVPSLEDQSFNSSSSISFEHVIVPNSIKEDCYTIDDKPYEKTEAQCEEEKVNDSVLRRNISCNRIRMLPPWNKYIVSVLVVFMTIVSVLFMASYVSLKNISLNKSVKANRHNNLESPTFSPSNSPTSSMVFELHP